MEANSFVNLLGLLLYNGTIFVAVPLVQQRYFIILFFVRPAGGGTVIWEVIVEKTHELLSVMLP